MAQTPAVWFLALESYFHYRPMDLNKARVVARNTNFAQRERKFHVIFALGSESSTYGTFAPGSESTRERKFQLPLYRPLATVSGVGSDLVKLHGLFS